MTVYQTVEHRGEWYCVCWSESEDHQFGSSAGAGCRVMTTRRTATLLVTGMMMVMMTSRQTGAVCE